ncbi:extracellular serine-threonine rich protein [Cordyceps fumosorosea ARSEF 2679]|uniref:Extracellular serine-threonine rich protein n=1 Tax=Cordyceps fumosorosea (strain ARSEF 2679) TaxID=1081104 RepID=A0A167SWP1_CORFA|nr:extracellular serine-threonine rich protein [Cordyceps fumosorosea ARSEF 2679]OAA60005.1 extracellular serine-threonine rich protein [Cordyceps fumosorosea ARSEF 2679]
MKVAYALALAATVEQASATAILGAVLDYWTNLQPFTCPGKTPVICKPDQVPGYDWKDTPIGPIGGYGGCDFKGWTCKKKFGRRDMLAGRQDDGSKVIEADVGADGESGNPVISAGNDIGTFDIDSFSVESEFDARFEFHYTMPDGSTCKQSSPVSSQGTSIVNTQCGGAKSVQLVLPQNQGNQKRTFLLKKSCKVKCHKIKFWCKPQPPKTTNSPPATPPAQTTTKNTPPPQTTSTTVSTVPGTTTKQTTPPAQSTSVSTPPGETTKVTTSVNTPPGETTKVTTSVQTTPGQSTPPAETTSKVTTSVNTPPGETTKITTSVQTTPGQSTPPAETTKVTTSVNTPPGETTKITTSVQTTPGQSTPVQSTPVESTPVKTTPGQTPPPGTTTSFITTTYETISTVFTTSTKTITSCGPEITSCPIKTPGETHTVTLTSVVSTTICPVTETRPIVITTQTQPGATQTQPTQSSEKPKESETKTSPPVPSQSLPCPESVPRCLMSWLDLVKECKNNADAECFCKNSEYTKNVFQCLYSYGGSDKNVADSITFFQGICAPYAGKNPNIVTGAETITQIITVTPAPLPSGGVTTITIDTTVTEPCVTSGTTITGSSTTRVISTQLPVPAVTLTPPPAGEKQPVPTGGVAPTTVAPGVPVGTGVPTVPSGTKPPVVVGGAGKAQAGILGAVVMAVIAAL